MSPKTKTAIYRMIACFIVAFLLSRKCTSDPYCDPDPQYGDCSQTCSYEGISLLSLGLRTYGLYAFGVLFMMVKDGQDENM